MNDALTRPLTLSTSRKLVARQADPRSGAAPRSGVRREGSHSASRAPDCDQAPGKVEPGPFQAAINSQVAPRTRRSISSQTGQLTALIAAIAAVSYAVTELWGSFLGLLPLLAWLLAPRELTGRWRPRTRVHVMLTLLMLAILAGAVSERPATMGDLAWTVLIPMAATLLLGPRAGAVWGAVCLACQLGAALAIEYGLFPTYDVRFPLGFQTLRFAFITITALRFSARVEAHASSLLTRVRRADEAKTAFLASVSHEIRTPLNGVLGMTASLLQQQLPRSVLEELEVVQRSGEGLLRLLNDLLDMTKVQRGALTLERIPFNLDQVLRDVVRMAPSRPGVKVDLEVQDAGTVLGDSMRVRQVLSNLLSNAAKFTERGSIVLRARGNGIGMWVFEVADTGMGMSPETLSTLFSPFLQADASISRRFGGTGLGLALVKSLCELMDGEIGVTSEAGKGTTARVKLLLPPTSAAAAREKVKVVDLAGTRLLVVDDNPVNLRVAQALLHRLGGEVTTATTGEQAVELALAMHFDVVLMDCYLPGIDGWEATRRIHGTEGLENVPVIALTAAATDSEKRRCTEAGMREVLTKPLFVEDLCRTLAPFATGPAKGLSRGELPGM